MIYIHLYVDVCIYVHYIYTYMDLSFFLSLYIHDRSQSEIPNNLEISSNVNASQTIKWLYESIFSREDLYCTVTFMPIQRIHIVWGLNSDCLMPHSAVVSCGLRFFSRLMRGQQLLATYRERPEGYPLASEIATGPITPASGYMLHVY